MQPLSEQQTPPPLAENDKTESARNALLRNRKFCAKMRVETYHEAFVAFQDLETLCKKKRITPEELQGPLNCYIHHLQTAAFYAEEAIRGLKRKRLRKYRYDKNYGVLEEEIVLKFFLDELLSSSEHLKRMLETDLNIQLYRERIDRYRSHRSKTPESKEGFLSKILESLDAVSVSAPTEIREQIHLVSERYQIGNNLLEVITRQLSTKAKKRKNRQGREDAASKSEAKR